MCKTFAQWESLNNGGGEDPDPEDPDDGALHIVITEFNVFDHETTGEKMLLLKVMALGEIPDSEDPFLITLIGTPDLQQPFAADIPTYDPASMDIPTTPTFMKTIGATFTFPKPQTDKYFFRAVSINLSGNGEDGEDPDPEDPDPDPGDHVGKTFEADGYEWLVIRDDGNGNLLITTTKSVGTIAYNSGDSSSDLPYPGSILDKAARSFYNVNLTVLQNHARPAVFPVERASTDYRNQSTGWSYVAAGGARTCFALSVTEIYNSPGFAHYHPTPNSTHNDPARKLTNGTSAGWWSRSPQKASKESIFYIDNNGAARGDTNFDDNKRGLRPALWIDAAFFDAQK